MAVCVIIHQPVFQDSTTSPPPHSLPLVISCSCCRFHCCCSLLYIPMICLAFSTEELATTRAAFIARLSRQCLHDNRNLLMELTAGLDDLRENTDALHCRLPLEFVGGMATADSPHGNSCCKALRANYQQLLQAHTHKTQSLVEDSTRLVSSLLEAEAVMGSSYSARGPSASVVDVSELLGRARERLELRARLLGVAVVLQVERGVPQRVVIDPLRVGAILANLLSNAVKFASKCRSEDGGDVVTRADGGGRVTLRVGVVGGLHEPAHQDGGAATAAADGDGVFMLPLSPSNAAAAAFSALLPASRAEKDATAFLRFEVVDNGPGIHPQDLAALYREYSQTRDGQSFANSSGLGLSIVRDTVEVLGGAIMVQTSTTARRTVFSITLPARVAGAAAGATGVAAASVAAAAAAALPVLAEREIRFSGNRSLATSGTGRNSSSSSSSSSVSVNNNIDASVGGTSCWSSSCCSCISCSCSNSCSCKCSVLSSAGSSHASAASTSSTSVDSSGDCPTWEWGAEASEPPRNSDTCAAGDHHPSQPHSLLPELKLPLGIKWSAGTVASAVGAASFITTPATCTVSAAAASAAANADQSSATPSPGIDVSGSSIEHSEGTAPAVTSAVASPSASAPAGDAVAAAGVAGVAASQGVGKEGEGAGVATATLLSTTFLVADDSALIRKYVATMLKRTAQGVTVVEACNGHEAVAAVTARAPALFTAIFMDGSMPVCDGYAAVRALRAGGYSGYIAGLTGDTDGVAAFSTAGADGTLIKPLQLASFRVVVAAAATAEAEAANGRGAL